MTCRKWIKNWKTVSTASDRTLVADAGYFSRDNVVACETDCVIPLISPSSKKHNVSLWERLAPSTKEEAEEDQPQCPVESMKAYLKTEEGRQLYAARKATAESVFGIIMQAMGFCQFLTRGLEAVESEWTLVCTVYNIKRLLALNTAKIRARTRPFATKPGLMWSQALQIPQLQGFQTNNRSRLIS